LSKKKKVPTVVSGHNIRIPENLKHSDMQESTLCGLTAAEPKPTIEAPKVNKQVWEAISSLESNLEYAHKIISENSMLDYRRTEEIQQNFSKHLTELSNKISDLTARLLEGK
jgi:hypothetical protein